MIAGRWIVNEDQNKVFQILSLAITTFKNMTLEPTKVRIHYNQFRGEIFRILLEEKDETKN